MLSVYLPIGVKSQLPREFADYRAEAENWPLRRLLATSNAVQVAAQ